MEPTLQRRVQRYGWDKAASFYETFWQEQLKPAQDLLLEMADLGRAQYVLDVACGTGLVSFRVLEEIDGGHLVGTDISEKMVALAINEAERKGETRASFKRMDAEELLLEPGTFDVALCALGLMYMPFPIKALQEIRRVLQPQGRVIAAVWGQRERCGWAEIFEIVDRHVSSEVCPMFFNLGNPGTLELSFEQAGYSNIVTRRIQTVLHYHNEKEALGAAFDGGPVALAYHRFDTPTKERVHADYLDSLSAYKNGFGYDVPGEFVVGRADR